MTPHPLPPIPADEARRLARLHQLLVLDTEAEPLLDHLVQWAAEVCGVPIALVSLVDSQRQWFKANLGLPGVHETPRELAFCAHAILDDALMEVPDATADARFAANPLVTGEPGIRFYAGAPLVLPGGERVGTLCVIDRQPRRLDAVQAAKLSRLALLASLALAMRGDLLQRALAARSEHERMLAASEAQHRAIVEEQSELISLAGADGRLAYTNPAYARALGRRPEQMTGASLYDFVDPADREMVRDRIAWVLETGEPIVGENRMCLDGQAETWIVWTNSLQLQADGQRWVRSVGRDISARKRAEAALRASQDFLHRTGRVAGVGGWELDLRTQCLRWSEQTRRIHELEPDYQPVLDQAIGFYAPESRPLIEAAVRQGMASGLGWDLELQLDTARGRRIWVRAVGEVEFDDGRPVRLVGAVQDISERKALQLRIAESERFVREITDRLSVRVAYVDRERRYRFVNQAHCQRFGLPREQILGRSRAELLGPNEPPEVAERIAAVLAGQAQRFEFEEQLAGRRVRIESRLHPDIDAQGQVRGFFATGIDVSDRHRDEQALRVLTAILDTSPDFILQSGPDGELLYMNPAARRIAGLAPQDPLQGRRALEFNTEATNRLIRQQLLPAVQRDGVWRGETEVAAADGRSLPVSHLAIAHRDDSGRITRYSSVLRDISSEVAARQQLLRQTATLRSVTEALPVIVSAVDAQLRYRFVNSAFEKWHGHRREDLLGLNALELMPADEREQSQDWARRALSGESVHFERSYVQRPGKPVLSLSYIPVRLDDGHIDGFVSVGFDITPHRREQVRLRALAERDALTGLLNRAGFEAVLARSLQAGLGAGLALLYIDLDHFKPVNDGHGHAVGDALLGAVAMRLQRLVRPSDAIARLGGDEFAVLLTGVRDALSARSVAHKVVEALGRSFQIDGLQLRIGASVGLAHGAEAGDGGRSLVQRADAQLYRAKQAGRGRSACELPTLTAD
ncbi:MAG: PAS domain S-box protein [Burkholderiaceae bacterium]|nr:PAS domain S-box protein [Burkholderiaceae bacterium]